MTLCVELYEYRNQSSIKIYCGGYNYSDGNWRNTFAYGISQNQVHDTMPVYFGRTANGSAICIGTVDTSWKHSTIAVTQVVVGHSNYSAAKWDDGWSITQVTTLPTVNANYTQYINLPHHNVSGSTTSPQGDINPLTSTTISMLTALQHTEGHINGDGTKAVLTFDDQIGVSAVGSVGSLYIKTNTIKSRELAVSNSTGSTRVFVDGDNNRIEVYNGGVKRVRIGKLV